MLDARHAAQIAERFALGGGASLSGPVARGEQGQIWRLTTSVGRFAVKQSFQPLAEAELREEADFQEAAHAAGVPTPAVIRTTDQQVLATLPDAQVRVYEWVELREIDRTLDPVAVGRTVAAIHRIGFLGQRPSDPWYTDAVGSERWDELVLALRHAAAPFAEGLAGYRDELVALESPWRLRPTSRPAIATSGRTTCEAPPPVIRA